MVLLVENYVLLLVLSAKERRTINPLHALHRADDTTKDLGTARAHDLAVTTANHQQGRAASMSFCLLLSL